MMLQGLFFLSFFAIGLVCVRLWRLSAVHRVPGCGWWAGGCAGIALATLLAGASPWVGEWARTMAAHVASIGGFCALWLGTRRFVGGSPARIAPFLFMAFLAFLAGVFFWLARIAPSYPMRLTINCVSLLLFSGGIARILFTARMGSGLVTTAGVLYMIFSLINTLRTVNIILTPAPGSFFLSNAASRNLTVAMVPVILAALVSLEFLARAALANETKDDS